MTPPESHPPRVDLPALADLAVPWAIRTVATLGVADHVAAGVHDVDELAGRCGADADALGRVLRLLACRGVFAQTGPRTFDLTEPARLLCRDHPLRMRDWYDLDGAGGRMDRAFSAMLDVVRGGASGYVGVHGRSIWDDAVAEPALARSYDDLMGAYTRFVGPALAAAHDWAAHGHVVDVGGGTGTLLAAILTAHPGVGATLVELPAAAEAARATPGLADRVEIVTGSFFDPLPRRPGCYLLSNVLHDWPDSDATAVLRRCAEAMAPDGRVVVVENLDLGTRPEVTSAMDLRLLVLFGGRERTPEQLDALTGAAGLQLVARTRPTGTAVLSEYRR